MFGKPGKGNIVLHGFLRLKRGRHRRYRCEACGGTFVSSVGTPYHRLRYTRAQFDKAAALSVEGPRPILLEVRIVEPADFDLAALYLPGRVHAVYHWGGVAAHAESLNADGPRHADRAQGQGYPQGSG